MATVDLNALNDQDIKYLINALKNPTEVFTIKDIQDKLCTLDLYGCREDAVILGIIDNIEYVLHIKTSKNYIEVNRYSIHLRFKKNNEHLIRLDVGSGHNNPPGYSSCKNVSHIHIYNPNVIPHDCIAIPLEESDFPNITTIIKAFDNFLGYTNIQKGG